MISSSCALVALGVLRQALFEEGSASRRPALELIDPDLIGKQRIPFRRQPRRSRLEFAPAGVGDIGRVQDPTGGLFGQLAT
jgi:hypothetical protein